MAFLQIQTRTPLAARPPLAGLAGLIRAILTRQTNRDTNRPHKSPEQIIAAQTRRAEARAAVDHLLR
ncbi:MAG: hypothetical protein CMF72_02655 [Mameliella sp.]|nr:hypothetical protein [Mameliella sp.]|tara:strand:- start:506 stop:706 length:201 start_codon:yes stop_codon:yes gene_type:complete